MSLRTRLSRVKQSIMKKNRFHLKIIPIKDILIHEELDQSRSRQISAQLKKEKYLINPILVASLDEEKYLQLDGMNRLSAFSAMGLKNILCQIVDYNDQDMVELSSWVHLFKNNSDDFINFAKKNKSLVVKKGDLEHVGHRFIKEKDFGRLCTVVNEKNQVFLISTGGNMAKKMKNLNYLVSFYKENLTREDLPFNFDYNDIGYFFHQYPNTNMMVIFPNFTPQQIIEVVENGGFFPPGVTRHIIKGRCLNVNIPLTFFANSQSVVKQNQLLKKFLAEKNVRFYEEPTIHFE